MRAGARKVSPPFFWVSQEKAGSANRANDANLLEKMNHGWTPIYADEKAGFFEMDGVRGFY
jgi:hypothetical protein